MKIVKLEGCRLNNRDIYTHWLLKRLKMEEVKPVATLVDTSTK